MADAFKTKTMKRKNIRGLALNAPAPKAVTPSSGDAQIPGGLGNNDRGDTLEIGVEFRLDLRSEDLEVIKELGAGNGGTVSKVQHAATKVVMARKVRRSTRVEVEQYTDYVDRLYMWKRRKRFENGLCESCRLCMSATHPILSLSTVLS
jgi:hypothetical protein